MKIHLSQQHLLPYMGFAIKSKFSFARVLRMNWSRVECAYCFWSGLACETHFQRGLRIHWRHFWVHSRLRDQQTLWIRIYQKAERHQWKDASNSYLLAHWSALQVQTQCRHFVQNNCNYANFVSWAKSRMLNYISIQLVKELLIYNFQTPHPLITF